MDHRKCFTHGRNVNMIFSHICTLFEINQQTENKKVSLPASILMRTNRKCDSDEANPDDCVANNTKAQTNDTD